VSTRRPRVVDEIRHGLWFFETSLWDAVPELARRLRRDLPGVDVPLRFGTWIGGDRDGFYGGDQIRATADLIPGARLILYRRKGHLGTVSYKPVMTEIIRFLA